MKLDRSLEILVVEDDFINQRVVASLLKRLGAQVTCADNGEIALSILEGTRFDAILMDLSMPVMDGFTATSNIRNTPEISKIPIFALTAHNFDSYREKCRDVGMDSFLTKPINTEALFEALAPLTENEKTFSL